MIEFLIRMERSATLHSTARLALSEVVRVTFLVATDATYMKIVLL